MAFNPALAPPGTFTEAELYLIATRPGGDMYPAERGKRARLLLREFDASDYNGNPVRTSMLLQSGNAEIRNQLYNILNAVMRGDSPGGIVFEGPDGFWTFYHEYITQFLNRIAELNRIRTLGKPEGKEIPQTNLWDIFGGGKNDWIGINFIPSDYDQIAVRVLQFHAPSLLTEVPRYVLRRQGIDLQELNYVPESQPATESELRTQIDSLKDSIDKLSRQISNLGRRTTGEPRPPRERRPPGPGAPQAPPAPPRPFTEPIPELPPPPPPPPPSARPLEELTAEVLRPNYLEDFVTYPVIVRDLESDVRSRNFSRCYLFVGPAGLGKTSLAFALPRTYLRAEGRRRNDPSLGAPDTPIQQEGVVVYSSDQMAAGQTELVRTRIRNSLTTAPFGAVGLHRFVILDDVARLTPEAQDALNRVLEQQAQRSSIIITANTTADKLQPGLRSRCKNRTYSFAPLTTQNVEQALLLVAQRANIQSPNLQAFAHDAAVFGEGEMRAALDRFLDLLRKEKLGS